jgi:hypothetical protein
MVYVESWFVYFPFTVDRIGAFSAPDVEVVLGFSHTNYAR